MLGSVDICLKGELNLTRDPMHRELALDPVPRVRTFDRRTLKQDRWKFLGIEQCRRTDDPVKFGEFGTHACGIDLKCDGLDGLGLFIERDRAAKTLKARGVFADDGVTDMAGDGGVGGSER